MFIVLCLIAQSCSMFCDPMACNPPGSVHGDSPGTNTGKGCHALLQWIFPTQGLNPGLPHRRQILYHLSHRKPIVFLPTLWELVWTTLREAWTSLPVSLFWTQSQVLGFPFLLLLQDLNLSQYHSSVSLSPQVELGCPLPQPTPLPKWSITSPLFLNGLSVKFSQALWYFMLSLFHLWKVTPFFSLWLLLLIFY